MDILAMKTETDFPQTENIACLKLLNVENDFFNITKLCPLLPVRVGEDFIPKTDIII